MSPFRIALIILSFLIGAASAGALVYGVVVGIKWLIGRL